MKSFLLIDDDPISNYLTSLIFKSLDGHDDYTIVNNGEDAIKYLENFKLNTPLIILLDIHMPGIDGYDFLDYLKDSQLLSDENLKIIVISSSITDKDIEKFKVFGICNYLTKPISKSSLELYL